MVRDGYFYGAGCLLAAGVIAWLAAWPYAIPLLLLAAFFLWFFRDPERQIPTLPGAVVDVYKRQAHGMKFASLPIPDRQVPNSESEVSAALDGIDADLSAEKNVVIHCRQGIGRTGLVAACLLVAKGQTPEDAVKTLSVARGNAVPETTEQRHWIDHYAAVLASTK